MKYESFIAQINELNLSQFTDIDIGSALYFYNVAICKPGTKIQSLLLIIRWLITNEIQIEKTENSEIAFLFSNNYRQRNDHYMTMKKLEALFPERCNIHPGERKLDLRNLKYLPCAIKWFFRFSRQFSFEESLYYTQILLRGITNSNYILKVILSYNCSKVIVYSDMHLIDSIVVQRCNRRGIITATLQHGNFETDEPFRLSKSKYFICYGEYTKQKAISFGMNESKLVEAGFIKYIGEEIKNKIQKKNKEVQSIGIILSSEGARLIDIKMIEMFKKYCHDNNIVLKVKCHPNYGRKMYPEIDWRNLEAFESEVTSQEFIETVDFVIVYSSTVFLECLMQMIPVAIYQDNEEKIFEGFDWCKFHNIAEFCRIKELIENQESKFEKNMLESREYYSKTGDISQLYRTAIESLN